MIVVEIGADREGAVKFSAPWRWDAVAWMAFAVQPREPAQFALERLARTRGYFDRTCRTSDRPSMRL